MGSSSKSVKNTDSFPNSVLYGCTSRRYITNREKQPFCLPCASRGPFHCPFIKYSFVCCIVRTQGGIIENNCNDTLWNGFLLAPQGAWQGRQIKTGLRQTLIPIITQNSEVPTSQTVPPRCEVFPSLRVNSIYKSIRASAVIRVPLCGCRTL